MKVAFFGYSWHPHGNLDNYLSEMVSALASSGLDVDIFMSNHFSDRLGIKGFSKRHSKTRLVNRIRSAKYDFAISINNGLVMPEIIDALDCRVVSVLVDGMHHFFDHPDIVGVSPLMFDVEICPISSVGIGIEHLVDKFGDRYHVLPPATQPLAVADQILPSANITWVASLVGDHLLDDLMGRAALAPSDHALLLKCLHSIEEHGSINLKPKDRMAIDEYLSRIGWAWDYFEVQMQNAVTSSHRLSAVEKLAHHGLRLYGNERWNRLLPFSSAVRNTLVNPNPISEHKDLMAAYNSSKICINIPQAHVAAGIQYRILDILSSDSLLVTQFHPRSELYRIFGKDCPIPFFKDLDNLDRICRYFLENEAERIKVVKRCNALVKTGFSHRERNLQYLQLSNRTKAAKVVGRSKTNIVGSVSTVNSDEFTNWTGLRA